MNMIKKICVILLAVEIGIVGMPVSWAEESEVEAGDTLAFQVKRQPKMNRVLTVDNNGKITVPMVGVVQASGKSLETLQDEITEALGKYLKSPLVSVKFFDGSEPAPAVMYAGDNESMATQVFPLKYADAKSLEESMKGTVSSQGSIKADVETNSLVVTDKASNISVVENVIRELDAFGGEARQIMIEAQIVELTNTTSEEIGAKWFAEQTGKHRYGTTFNKAINLEPRPTEWVTQDVLEEGTTLSKSTRVPIPNTGFATLAEGGTFSFGQMISEDVEVNGILNALATEGKAKILARPKVVVENGKEAKIEIVSKLPYRELSRISTSATDQLFVTNFVDVGVILKVQPVIRKGGVVDMVVEPEVSFVQGQMVDIPVKVSRKASTKVNVLDGHTLVIGGLLQDRETKQHHAIPFLSELPMIGRMFRYETTSQEKTELMVFITPKILTREAARNVTNDALKKAHEVTTSMTGGVESLKVTNDLMQAETLTENKENAAYQEALNLVAEIYKMDPDNPKAKELETKIRSEMALDVQPQRKAI